MNTRQNADDASWAPELVLLGNLLVDDIVLRDGRTLMGEPGGAILHAALGAQLWGVRVGLVSVAGDDYPLAALEALANRGIDLAGVRYLNRRGGRAWLLHEAGVRRVIHHLDCPTHDEVSPTLADIPDNYWSARAFHLAPMPIARQQQLAAGLAARANDSCASTPWLVSLDPCELVRDDNLVEWSQVLAHVDAFFPSQDELRISGDPAAIVRGVAGKRLRFVALKRGAEGGRLLDFHSELSPSWTARARHSVDSTGAGDAFVGGFLAGWLAYGDAQRGVEQGIVGASFAIEDWGARGLLAATPEQARSRWQEWFGVPVRT
jgi:sugar/nucleoside kinase (ribokinase family)